MLINRDELKAQMIRKHCTRDELANALNISLRSLNDKINGVRDFRENEIYILVSRFGSSIFFDFCLSEKHTKKGGKQ